MHACSLRKLAKVSQPTSVLHPVLQYSTPVVQSTVHCSSPHPHTALTGEGAQSHGRHYYTLAPIQGGGRVKKKGNAVLHLKSATTISNCIDTTLSRSSNWRSASKIVIVLGTAISGLDVTSLR